MKTKYYSAGGLLLTLLVAGCATPYESCVREVSKDYRALNASIDESRLRISRGYAIHRQTVAYDMPSICHHYDKNTKSSTPYRCFRTGYRTIETPVPISVAEERRKLATYQKQLPKAEASAKSGLRQCEVQFPDQG